MGLGLVKTPDLKLNGPHSTPSGFTVLLLTSQVGQWVHGADIMYHRLAPGSTA